jgi:hypothetical protein
MPDEDTDYSGGEQYTVRLNNKEYHLNEEARRAIQKRAEYEYEENGFFTCWWKRASSDQYEGEEWDETVHDSGDPVLVIETEGPIVPWERLDELNVEMQGVGPQSQLNQQTDDVNPNEADSGNGMRSVDPSDIDDSEREVSRTHFDVSPQNYEEVPSPDGEEPNKLPPVPEEMGDEPVLVKWIPSHPEIDHTWESGESMIPVASRVEWNVQKRADQPRPSGDKIDSHDHWASILSSYECEVVRELKVSQEPSDTSESSDDDDDVPRRFKEGTAGGGHWRV